MTIIIIIIWDYQNNIHDRAGDNRAATTSNDNDSNEIVRLLYYHQQHKHGTLDYVYT